MQNSGAYTSTPYGIHLRADGGNVQNSVVSKNTIFMTSTDLTTTPQGVSIQPSGFGKNIKVNENIINIIYSGSSHNGIRLQSPSIMTSVDIKNNVITADSVVLLGVS